MKNTITAIKYIELPLSMSNQTVHKFSFRHLLSTEAHSLSINQSTCSYSYI